jgi:RIO kinase 2
MDVIHADLSEYNIFVSEDGVQLIDWPQYVNRAHPHAEEFLRRDVSNVLTHFERKYGLRRDVDKTCGDVTSGTESVIE